MCPVAPGDGRRVSMPRDACREQRAEPCLNDTSPPSWFEWYFTYVFLGVLLYNTYEIARRHSVCISSPEWATLLSHRFLEARGSRLATPYSNAYSDRAIYEV